MRTHSASQTPIYDALYSEYLRSFRALPYDRTGEEDLGFTAFGALTTPAAITPVQQSAYGFAGQGFTGHSSSGHSGVGGWNGSAWQTEPWPAVYAAQPTQVGTGSAGNGGGRQHQTGMHHIPAALPPAPRRTY
ncbi:hypothetical protein [Streptomyces sp. NPDC048603]|uniref:hypothetical protein n=1 Tax=Streptomyces sp. NPDC048603 TaxID=3365577 RepID=UPI00371E989A